MRGAVRTQLSQRRNKPESAAVIRVNRDRHLRRQERRQLQEPATGFECGATRRPARRSPDERTTPALGRQRVECDYSFSSK